MSSTVYNQESHVLRIGSVKKFQSFNDVFLYILKSLETFNL